MLRAIIQGIAWLTVLGFPVSLWADIDLYDLGEAYRSFETRMPQADDPNQLVTVWSVIRNGGTRASGSFVVRFYASTDATISKTDYVLGEATISSIGGGALFSFRCTRAVPRDVPEGTYSVGWIIDPDNRVNESDENNNTACVGSGKLTVTFADVELVYDNVYYVDRRAPGYADGSSWFNAFRHIQDALAVVGPSSEIRVAQGIYKPDKGSGSREASFRLRSQVALRGGYAGYGASDPDARDIAVFPTTLSGDLSGNDVSLVPPDIDPCSLEEHPSRQDNSFHVVTANGTDESALLDGFIIESGHANDYDPDVGLEGTCRHCNGAGLACHCRTLIDIPGSPKVTNCTFRANYARRFGAGVHVDDGGHPTIEYCTFESNAAGTRGWGGWGAGMYCEGDATIGHCTFRRNWAASDGHGGGLYYIGNGSVADCTFLENCAEESGGGAYIYESPAFANCEFTSNQAKHSGGGGVYISQRSNPRFNRCVFSKNSPQGVYGRGGNLAGERSSLVLTDCQIFSNTGGGISLIACDAELIRCHIRDNHANYGGGVYSSNSDLLVTHCQINHNDGAYHGGGIYCHGGTAVFSNCVLCDNANDLSGEIKNWEMSGGAIYTDNVEDLWIGNCTFYKNWSFGGGEALFYESNVARDYTIHNSILWDEHDSEVARGGDVSSISSSYCCIKGGDPTAHPERKNINKDPLFTDAPDDLTLFAGSPCIDAGNGGLVLADSADLDDDGNTNEKVPLDLGGNPRFMDDPFTPDTGDETWFPVVDIGAYEFQEGSSSGACIIYVDDSATGEGRGTSWQHAFRYLQEALAVAREGCEIRVAKGIYRPDEDTGHPHGTGDRNATFALINGVRVKGGYAGFGAPDPNDQDPVAYETILSGDLLENDAEVACSKLLSDPSRLDNSLNVVTGHGTNSTAWLYRFTIIGGNANEDTPHGQGGGMLNRSGSPTVSSCIFRYNSARVSGGAVCNWTSAAHILYCTFACNYSGSGGAIWNSPDNTGAIIRDCRFGENGAYSGGAIENWGYCSVQDCWFFGNIATNEGGAISNTGRSNTVRACAFLLNRADKRGGAIYNSCDLGEIIDCAFADNRTADDGLGGGICNYKSSDLSIVKCRFENNFARRGGGIGNDNSTLEVINCAFTDNTAEDGAGMYNVYTQGVPMINCTLKDNSATRYGGGVFSLASGDDNPELINCVVWNNTDTDGLRESEWSQIYCVNGKPTVRYSCVQGWTGTWGGVMNTGADPEFADSSGALSLTSPCVDAGDNTGVPNDEWDLDGDIDNAERLPLDLAGNPRFVDYAGASDRGKGDAPIVDMGAYEFGTENGHPITAIFVDENAPAGGADDGSSWENAFHFLQDALAAAEPGSHILVAQGTYTPDLGTNHRPLHREESFVIKNSVTLLGGYAGNTLKRPLAADPSIRNLSVYETILSGDLNHDDVSISDPGVLLNHACRDDNSYCVVSCEVTGGPVLLDGFTISGGNGTEDSDSMNDSSRSGAGIYTPETRMKITRCIFANNAAPYVGGALWVGRESDVEVLDCVFRYNWGGRYGGAIALDSSYSKIKKCVFETNGASRGGALYVSTLPGAVLGTSHCRFNNNRGTISAGAILVDQGALELSYCAFRGNTAPTSGGAIHLSGASGPDSVLAYRCTFAQNSASNGAALCAWATSTVAVDSCILWDTLDGTSQDEIWSDPSDPATTVSVEYSCVARGWHSDGMTNIAVDPRFADNELHLHFSSPCVDRGSSEALVDAQDALDLDGNPAWVGDRPDMGAYEHQETQQAAVVELNEDNIGEWISLGVVLVDFYSPGCSACQLQLPILDEVARQIGDKAIVAKCNTDKMSIDAIKQYDIVFLPTLILFKDGEAEKRWDGLQEAATLISAIMDALK